MVEEISKSNKEDSKNHFKEKIRKTIGSFSIEVTPCIIPFTGDLFVVTFAKKNDSQYHKFWISAKMYEKFIRSTDEKQIERILYKKLQEKKSTSMLEYITQGEI
ncbi:MAG: hypothetical protein NWE89_12965 [Candidatus Bathyarchaeota archaeon]|nr:hypothetical protein [Candidatus Bathyarchaeota archaeon]